MRADIYGHCSVCVFLTSVLPFLVSSVLCLFWILLPLPVLLWQSFSCVFSDADCIHLSLFRLLSFHVSCSFCGLSSVFVRVLSYPANRAAYVLSEILNTFFFFYQNHSKLSRPRYSFTLHLHISVCVWGGYTDPVGGYFWQLGSFLNWSVTAFQEMCP